MKYYPHVIISIILFSFIFPITNTITGIIVDENNRPITGVNVYSDNIGTTTDENGIFLLDVEVLNEFTVSHIGFKTINITPDTEFMTIILKSVVLHGEKIVVLSGLEKSFLRDVTSSITVINQFRLEENPGEHFQNYINSITNLNWAGGTSRPRYFQIRGIGERSLYAGEGPPNVSVGFMIDDIDFSGIGMPSFLYDMKQIEIFKGPQSSLFGPNSMAGLISMYSNSPTPYFNGNIYTEIGTDNTKNIGIVLNKPIGKRLSSRISLFNSNSNGFRTNIFHEKDDTNGKQERFIRTKFLWTPINNLKIKLTAFYSDLDNKYDVWAPDNNEDLNTYTDRLGKDNQQTGAFSLKNTFNNILRFNVLSNTTYSENNMEYSYDGDWGNNTFWSGEPYNFPDNDSLFYDYFSQTFRNRETFTQEFRLSSNISNKSKTPKMIIGLYLKNQSESDSASGWIFGGSASNLKSLFEISNLAGYLKINQNILDGVNSSFNLRIESNKIEYTGQTHNFNEDSTDIQRKTNHLLTGFKISINYQIDPYSLLYSSIAKGYKTGGINQNPYLPSKNSIYNPEYNYNYEIGFKTFTEFMNSQLTMFYMDRRDQQVNISYQFDEENPDSFIYYTANSTTGYNYGAEFEHSYSMTDNLNLFYNIGYLITWVSSYQFKMNDSTTMILGGREQAQAPKYNYSYGLNYTYPFDIKMGVEIIGKDKYYFSDSHNEISKKYELVNVNIAYEFKSYILTIWCNNILNKRYPIRGFYFGLEPPSYEEKLYLQWGDPVQYGISLKYHF